MLHNNYEKTNKTRMAASDRIDKVVTSRISGLPIFVLVMGVVYWLAMGPLGTFLTDWTNDDFGGWSAYSLSVLAIIISGIILKKTRMFAGDPAPFVMELPAYHVPSVINVLRGTWERVWSFIKRAGSVIVL